MNNKPKIVVLDGYVENPGDLSWAGVEALGELVVYDRCPDDEDEIIRRLAAADILVANKTKITRKVIESTKLKYITVLATGYNMLDIACAREYGISVSNVPGYGTASVAQFAIALLLEICSRVAHHSEAVHQGRWESCPDWTFWDYPLIELSGKTMGIIGFGSIGQSVGRIAKAMGMRVITHSRSVKEEGKLIADYVDLDTLFRESDVISLHCPLFPETKNIINKNNIAKMKDGVIIINNSRGGLVVEQDLVDALNSGKVAAAGLDVVSEEPIKGTNPLLTAKNCFITPHISWAPKESRQRIMDTTVENIKAFLAGKPQNVVNP